VSGLHAFLDRALPSARTALTLGPVFLLATLAAGGLAGHLRVARGVRTPYTRKVFHFVIFTLASVVQLTRGFPAVLLFGAVVAAVVLYAVLRGDGHPLYEAMARPTDAPHRTLFVLVPLATTALGGVLANVFFGPTAFVGYLVGGWGDAVGEPVGTAWGRHRYSVPTLAGVRATRSFEGSAAVLLAGAIAAAVGLAMAGVAPGRALSVGLCCGAAGAAVEAVSHHGTDNLTIQLAAAGTAYLLLAA
jgi:phytol kinase